MILIISTSMDPIGQNGKFYWGEKYIQKIIPFLPQNVVDIISIQSAVLYFSKANQKNNMAVKLNITESRITNSYFKLQYNLSEELSFKSFQVKEALKKIFNKKTILDLPFCSAVDENIFYDTLENTRILSEIECLQGKNNWQEIISLFNSFKPIEKNSLWNDSIILSKFSFAAAKLSECGGNLKKLIPDQSKRAKYISEKRKYRELAIKLRNRCIQLDPENPAFYSNLAYTYYQSVSELKTPGCRKDGKLIDEAKMALTNFDKALELDNSRITDHYRKGLLQTEILAENIFFGKTDCENNSEKFQAGIGYLSNGLISFQNAVNIYTAKSNDEQFCRRYRKYYIKSLYYLAQTYLRLGKEVINSDTFTTSAKLIYISEAEKRDSKISNLQQAESAINKCITEDCTKEGLSFEDAAEQNNFQCAVYKCYLKAVIHLFLFHMTSDNKHSQIAKEYFYKALEISFPPELKNQSKLFVLDKIALLNIIESKFSSAIKLLEPHYKNARYFPDFAAYTLALAYLLNGQSELAKQITEECLKNTGSILYKKFLKMSQTISLGDQQWDNLDLIYMQPEETEYQEQQKTA
ncbi:MAG: hypothetical protein HXY49_11265 [Ignavibacteriaceae bacterium]|nr:hypothetical protein [Ignavibacteriaceae bacterium]